MKFGLYEVGSLSKPKQEYEGDYLSTTGGDTVSVIAKDDDGVQRTVAVVRLAEGQSVKKMQAQGAQAA